MTTPTTADLLKYADLQMAAEAFLAIGDTVKTGNALRQALIEGNLHNSVFTATQADNFLTRWDVVDQKANTATGFSGTLFRNKETGELVVSMRSTEFIDDAARDNQATNGLEIRPFGWAFGQISDMQTWVNSLLDSNRISLSKTLTVTGYSLGGHLATAFELLYPDTATSIYTFNGAGIGKISSGISLKQVIDAFDQRRGSGANADMFTNAQVRSLYDTYKNTVNRSNGAVTLDC